MRILRVGPWSSGSAIHQATVRTLRDLGHHVTVFDQRADHHPLLWPLPRFFARRLRWRIPTVERANRRYANRRLLLQSGISSPNLVLISKGDGIFPETLRALRRRGIVVANWFLDAEQQWEWVSIKTSVTCGKKLLGTCSILMNQGL
jgi:hypothetical protein